MGILSFTLGACAGYYLRNTPLGIAIGKKLLIASKFPLFQLKKSCIGFVTNSMLLKNKVVNEYKLVLVVRDDLNMSKGKIASQCSHASVLAFRNASISDPDIANLWEAFGQGKIVLKASNELKLMDLTNHAKKLGLFTNLVCDAGKTEVSPGTKTVLAIGPGPRDVIDEVTKHLRLL